MAMELSHMTRAAPRRQVVEVEIAPQGSAMANYAFDVTPAHLVTGLVTERGVCAGRGPGQAVSRPRAERAGVMRNLWSDRDARAAVKRYAGQRRQ